MATDDFWEALRLVSRRRMNLDVEEPVAEATRRRADDIETALAPLFEKPVTSKTEKENR